MTKMGQINIRMDAEMLAQFAGIADQLGLPPGTLGTNVIRDFVQIYHYKIQRGDITLSKPIIKKIFECIEPERYDEIIKYTAEFIFSEIKSQEGKVTYEILLEHFAKWNKGRIQFRRIKQDGSDMIFSKHLMCKGWSQIQSGIYAKCFEMAGETVIDMDYESEESYSFTVTKPEQVAE